MTARSQANTAAAKPFPFASLEHLSRADVATAARMRRAAKDFVALETIETALGELVDERVRIAIMHVRRLEAARGAGETIGVVLASADERLPSRRVLIEVEGALAATLSSRALRQKAPRVVDASRAPSPALVGAFAAVLVAAMRRAHAGSVTRVIAAGPGADLARDLLLVEREVTTATLTVFVGDDAFAARVSVPDALVPAPRHETMSRDALARMGDATIAMPLLVATTAASRTDLAELAPGDVFVPAKSGLAAGANGALVGAVALVPPSSERGLSADLAEGGRLVVRGLLESHPWIQERSMPSDATPTTATTTLEVLEDAPVLVRVELGTVEMKAREWAELGPGDVIALGRRVGDPAILRVGGVELARGELVQVEGEYGVRIVARTRGGEGR
ncbi:MAG: Type secretion inner rane protein [Labilithrix sp.]|nr:Type secretion inner rane protein [Labilithrix sp.]